MYSELIYVQFPFDFVVRRHGLNTAVQENVTPFCDVVLVTPITQNDGNLRQICAKSYDY
jgi:hypothetical protein